MLTTNEILEKFAEYIDYQRLKGQSSFNMFSSDYKFREIGDNIKELLKFDPSGNLAVMFAAKEFENVMKEAKVSVLDILENPGILSNEAEIYQMFTSPEVDQIEEEYIDDINKVVSGSTKLLGKRDKCKEKEILLNNIVSIAKEVRKLSLDIYLKNKHIEPTTNIMPCILAFDTTSEAVLKLENATDGVYLTYINNNYTADGYFAIFIKSNSNLISFNDRVNELYKGQHHHSRNGRWSEEHCDIFPYDQIFEYSEYDYKGYAASYRINKDKLEFLKQGPDVYIPLIILLVTLGENVNDSLLESPVKYIDMLTDTSLLAGGSKNELVIPHTSLIARNTKILDFTFDMSKVFDGSYGKEFGGYMQQNEETEYFINRYGLDFVPDNTDLSINGAEMIADENTLRCEAYRNLRIQLRNHIARKMEKIYNDAGRAKGISEKYAVLIRSHKDRIIDILVKAYANAPISAFKELDYDPEDHTCSAIKRQIGFTNNAARDVLFTVGDKHPLGAIVLNDRHPKSKNKYDDLYACPVTGAIPTVWISFSSKDWKEIEAFLGEDVPEYLKGYRTTRLYNGNSILDATDPCNDLHNPVGLEQCVVYDAAGIEGYKIQDHISVVPRYHSTMARLGDICIGFSKRGIKKLIAAEKPIRRN